MGDLYAAQIVCVGFYSFPGVGARAVPLAYRGSMGKEGRFEVKKGRRVEKKMFVRLKASKPFLHTNSNKLYDMLHFAAFPAASAQLKKPSVARRAYRSPMPWGLAAGGNFLERKSGKIFRNR
jgi:hypothetical protein